MGTVLTVAVFWHLYLLPVPRRLHFLPLSMCLFFYYPDYVNSFQAVFIETLYGLLLWQEHIEFWGWSCSPLPGRWQPFRIFLCMALVMTGSCWYICFKYLPNYRWLVMMEVFAVLNAFWFSLLILVIIRRLHENAWWLMTQIWCIHALVQVVFIPLVPSVSLLSLIR